MGEQDGTVTVFTMGNVSFGDFFSMAAIAQRTMELGLYLFDGCVLVVLGVRNRVRQFRV